MSHVLTLELPERIFDRLAGIARAAGQTPEECAVQFLGKAIPDDEDRRKALERLLEHGGKASAGRALGAENSAIDADLAREAEVSHEAAP